MIEPISVQNRKLGDNQEKADLESRPALIDYSLF